MKFNKDTFDIVFFARGGQGAKTAAEIVAQAAVSEGKFVQAFPSFGPERSGAPTKTFVKISNAYIQNHEPVTDPDLVIVLDETILGSQDVTDNLDENESLIINTPRTAEEIKIELEKLGKKFSGKIHPVDANGISLEIIGQPRPNTVILGKIAHISAIAKLESIVSEFKKLFEPKIGEAATSKNVLAIEKAYDTL